MRGFLLLAATLAVLAVAFLMAWPRLVDVPALRGELARLVQEAGGEDLRIEGAMRLELLPVPRVVIERAVVGDRVAIGPGTRFGADRVDVELAPLALLAGRIEPIALQLVRPRLVLAGTPAPMATALVRALSAGPLAGVRRIDLVDGAVRLAGTGHRLPTAYDAVDLVAQRDGERRFRVEGAAAVGGAPVRLSLTGEPLAAEVPIDVEARIEAGPRAAPAVLEFAGEIAPGPSVDGAALLDTERGPLPSWVAEGVELRGRAEASLRADRDGIELADLLLTLPEGQLRGALSLGDAGADLSLDGTTLAATPPLLATGRRLLAVATSRTGLDGRVSLRLASFTWRGAPVRRLHVEAGLVGGKAELRRLDAILPGQAALSWTGSAPQAADAITGELTLQAAELRPLLGWLGVTEADLPKGGLTSLDLAARATIGAGSVSLRAVRARLDASRLEGSLAYVATSRPRLDLALTADRLNTALYGAPPASWADWRGHLEALDGTIDLTIDRLSHDILRGQGFRLRGAVEGGRLDLAELRLGDLTGAALTASGRADVPRGTWEAGGRVRLPEPKPILRLLGIEPPPELDRLAPIELRADGRREAGTATLDLRLTARNAEMALQGQLAGAASEGALDVAVTARAAEAAELLQALGWPAPARRPTFGPLTLAASARRTNGPIALTGELLAGGDRLGIEAALTPGAVRPRLGGSLRAAALDAGLLAACYETLALPLDFPPGRPWLWPGAWPRTPLGWQWLDRLDLDLALEVARLRLGGRDLGRAGADVSLSDGALVLRGIDLPLAGGRLGGVVTLEGRGDHAVLGADLRLENARAETLAAATASGSALRGELDLDAALLTQGRSVAELVAGLAGSGSLDLSGGGLSGVELGTGGIGGAALAGPFAIADGLLATTPRGLELGAAGTVTLRLDLLAWILDAQVAAGGVTRRYLGPPGRLRAVAPP